MPNPTFNGIELTALAARTQLSSRQSRAVTETMPGVNGVFVQPLGTGGRRIEVSGLLCQGGYAAPSVRSDVLAAFRQREALADGRTIADFVDADGTTYPACMVTRISHGPLRVASPIAGVCAAYLPITVELLQLNP
jgi:hypothetical protein